MEKITIKDVAKKAGVSIATVSRVFNNYTDISEQTRKRVFQIANEVGYSPNVAARALSSKSQRTIALVFNDLTYHPKYTMPMSILNGVFDYADSQGIEFAFYVITTQKQKQKTYEQFCSEHNVNGVIVQGLRENDPYFEQLKVTHIPTVLIDMFVNNPHVSSVTTDNLSAAKDAVNTLIKSGCRNIDMMNGAYNASVSILREQGYKKALTDAGLPLDASHIQYANYDEQIANLMAKQALKQDPTIDAFFCASDIMALGVLQACKDLGKKVPQDLKIIGFDGLDLVSYVTPALSTVAQQPYEFGQEAGRLIQELMSSPLPKTPIVRHVPYKLYMRESTKNLN
ncbi:LacI family DNA-binding transcriptional regulator [Lactiplantibacillus carotarum]|uniref:LacI family DNA-binding transcriptional regulator n=1 Tax=Lactiplantibacillus carotarum TaxID=2993456 RepID=UPI00298EF0DE|nr:LacI family DNA-binding transcriptional regulator [Lactiplantibacillus carotarum]